MVEHIVQYNDGISRKQYDAWLRNEGIQIEKYNEEEDEVELVMILPKKFILKIKKYIGQNNKNRHLTQYIDTYEGREYDAWSKGTKLRIREYVWDEKDVVMNTKLPKTFIKKVANEVEDKNE